MGWLLAEGALQVPDVFLRFGEQRPQSLCHIGQPEVGRLLHSGPVAVQLVRFESEVRAERFVGVTR